MFLCKIFVTFRSFGIFKYLKILLLISTEKIDRYPKHTLEIIIGMNGSAASASFNTPNSIPLISWLMDDTPSDGDQSTIQS